jgi:ubiquinone/menaquinone biosynthesis C-methylase UbiE
MKNFEVIMNDNIDKFTGKAENYAKYRLEYSNEILKYFKEYHFGKDSVIADIGSGTGKLTKIFLDNGNIVYAVEPNDNMRNTAELSLNIFKNFISINGTAENTTLQSSIIDFVVAGQAFHWFDTQKALNEFKRILKKNGVLVIIWYNRKTDTPFLKEYDSILQNNPAYKGSINKLFPDDVIESFYSKDYKKNTFEENREINFDELIGGFLSSSYSPKEGSTEYNESYKLLDKIFNEYKINDKVIFSYETKIYTGRL